MKARCYRSLRKNEEPHYVVVKMKNEDRATVGQAHCSCKGGSGGHCNHMFALLFQLNDYSCLGMKDIPSDATSTLPIGHSRGTYQELHLYPPCQLWELITPELQQIEVENGIGTP